MNRPRPPAPADARDRRAGVLLVNLGTPDAPTSAALRRYLGEFLADPDVVTLPRLLWWPILHGLVLRTRPARSAEAYRRIWTDEGSPLLVNTLALKDKFAAALQQRLGSKPAVAVGMRYGKPSLLAALTELRDAGVEQLLVLPLYPQYARATTGSTATALQAALRKLAWSPAHALVRGYPEQPAYIAALAESVQEHWAAHGRGGKLLVSFHGIPKQVSDTGDPYRGQCEATARLLAERLGLKDGEWRLVFQSRFGKAEWLQPYAEDALRELAANGVKDVDVICPGFAADCLETLEEIALRYAQTFRDAGGAELRYVPALNARDSHVRSLVELTLLNLRELRAAGA
ncbi:MAG TPA: ferrochelatase [Gammaproteobacteria bacterium]|nr:ferrochelatase [Gammaproteobacteria bacterium]